MPVRYRRLPALLLALLLLLALPMPAEAAGETPDWDLTPLPESWFDDAVFIGDSISVVLKKQCDKFGGLGDALFLCEFSFGIRNAVLGNLKLWYQGKEYLPQEVLPLTGANKLFIMVGVNDIALWGGIDKTMECWETFAENVQAACPDLQVFVQSHLPIWHEADYEAMSNAQLLRYNERLRSFCEEKGFVYVDLADYFRDETGGIAQEFTADYYVHINYPAAELWVEQLKNPANYSMDPRGY